MAVGNNQALQGSTVTPAGGNFIASRSPTRFLARWPGAGNLSLAGLTSLTVGGNAGSTTYSGGLSGSASGGLIKAGTGTWTLTGTNTQTGPFNIQAGTVLIGSAGGARAERSCLRLGRGDARPERLQLYRHVGATL